MKTLLTSIAILFILSTGLVHAQSQRATQAFCQGGSCTYVPLEPLPGLPDCYGPNPPSSCKNPGGSFGTLVGNSFKLLIGAGALIAIIMIVLGALTYMFSDIAGNKKNALTRIRNAMWAIVILVSSYLILYTINPELVTFNLNLTPASGVGSSATSGGTAQTQAPSSGFPLVTYDSLTSVSRNSTASVAKDDWGAQGKFLRLCENAGGSVVNEPSSNASLFAYSCK